MRPGPSPAHHLTVRFLVDISRDGDGRITGHVEGSGGGPVPFSGWLELLRLLEDRAPLAGVDGGTPASGANDLAIG
jgi:hypothetical protein